MVSISSPTAMAYLHSATVNLTWTATDVPSGVASVVAKLDGTVTTATSIELHTLALGSHEYTVTATDFYGNETTASVTFTIKATVDSLSASVRHFYDTGQITSASVRDSLLSKLAAIKASIAAGKDKVATSQINAFISLVRAQTGKSIKPAAAAVLIADARYLIAHL
jgi:hypothetical protein